jgi:glucoamylase
MPSNPFSSHPIHRHHGRAEAALAGAGALVVGGALALAWPRSGAGRGGAPGRPGADPLWSPSDKAGVGTAMGPGVGPARPVWFTLNRGGLTEVYYPHPHAPCVRDLALAVTDGARFVSDERRDARHEVEPTDASALMYKQTNICQIGRYRVEKETVASPRQDAVVQRVRFTPLVGTLADYRLYALLNPHMGLRRGLRCDGRVGAMKGRRVLLGWRDEAAMALDASAPWRALTVGYLDASDGWTDLRRHARLTRSYDHARDGNVVLTGEIDLAACGGEFTLALGLGLDPCEAAHAARASLIDGFDALRAAYLEGWRGWQAGLADLDPREPGRADLYRASTAVLRAHEGKAIPGAVIASLSIPWGADRGDGDLGTGGYHLVWPRDLAEVAGGFLAAGALDDARRVLDYLHATQEADGHWPQNMWLGGEAYWSGIQMGETALPLVLLGLLDREGLLTPADHDRLAPMVDRAVRYILRNGPSSQEDRWENAKGFAPYTLSALVVALLVAADLADRRGGARPGAFLRETADAWNDAIEYWTYAEGTELARRVGVRGYYLRVAPPDGDGEPRKAAGRPARPPGRRAEMRARPDEVVSPDALALVRFGLRAPDDPRILDTVRVIDAVLKVETPSGPAWRRYVHDGYGETRDGRPYNPREGVGRAWPLLTGERAHYELAAGRPADAERLARAMEGFASPGGMLPEQVWDSADIPARGLYLGRPTGSAMPLAWAHAEYIKLLRSLRDGRVFDLPARAHRRYVAGRAVSPRVLWRPDHRRGTLPAGKLLRVEAREPAEVRWRAGGREDRLATTDSGLGVHYADLPTADLPAGSRVLLAIRGGSTSESAEVRVVDPASPRGG